MPEKIARRKTAILWNLENFWSLNRQRQTRQWDAWGFPGKYQEILKSFGAPVDVVGESADLSKYEFVIIPAYELVDSALVKKWTDYATNGGRLGSSLSARRRRTAGGVSGKPNAQLQLRT